MSYQDIDDDKLFLHLSSASAREINAPQRYRRSDQVTVFLPRQLEGMFTRNQAQSKYWKLQIDKNLATNGSRGSGTRPNHSLLSSLNIVPSDVRRRHMDDTDVSRK